MEMTVSTNRMVNKSTINNEFTTDNSKSVQINVYSNVYRLIQTVFLLVVTYFIAYLSRERSFGESKFGLGTLCHKKIFIQISVLCVAKMFTKNINLNDVDKNVSIKTKSPCYYIKLNRVQIY